MSATISPSRAFAVWFKDLERWSVSSFFRINWEWPASIVQPLALALEHFQIEHTYPAWVK